MVTTARRVAFWAMAVFGVVLAIVQLLLVVQTWSDPTANAHYWRLAALFQGISGAVYLAVGLLLARRRPAMSIGWLLASIGLGILVYQGLSEYAVRALLVEDLPLPLGNEAALLSQTTWIVPFAIIPVLLLVYPTGRFISKLWIWAAVASCLSALIVLVVLSVILWPHRTLGAKLLDEENVGLLPTWPVNIALQLLVGAVLVSIMSLIVRWRRGDPVVRLQLKWLLLAGLAIGVQGLLIFINPDFEGPTSAIEEALLLAGLIGMPVAVGIAVLRYRLFEIDRIISRTLTYGLLTALLAAMYLGLVITLRSLFPVEGSLPVAASTLAVAALFSPLRRRLQVMVARRFNRAGYDADRALSALSSRLREHIDLEPLRNEMAGFANKTVQPTTVSVWFR